MRKGIAVYLLASILNLAYLRAQGNSSETLALSQAVNQKIVVFKNPKISWEEKEELIRKAGGEPRQRLPLINGVLGHFPQGMALSLDDDSSVGFIADNDYMELIDQTPATGREGKSAQGKGQEVPWGILRVAAIKAWALSRGQGAKACVVDSGVDLKHPDLQGNIVGGRNFSNDGTGDENIQDDQGHGSHVNGTIAAVDNDQGVVGVAPQASLIEARVFGSSPYTTLAQVIAGIEYCASIKAHVVNMSLGSSRSNEAPRLAIKNAHAAGVTLVAAAGNASRGPVGFPGAYPEVIGVSASNINNQFAPFSSQGPEVDVIAPGADVKSTVPSGEYDSYSGTSMATPHVVGVAALIISKNPSLTNIQVKTIIELSAVNIGLKPDEQGKGQVNAARGVEMAIKTLRNRAISSQTDVVPLSLANAKTLLKPMWDARKASPIMSPRGQQQKLVVLFGN